MNLRQLDKKYFGRQGDPQDVIVGNSADSYLTDARGRKYSDFMMGWCVGNLGWGVIGQGSNYGLRNQGGRLETLAAASPSRLGALLSPRHLKKPGSRRAWPEKRTWLR